MHWLRSDDPIRVGVIGLGGMGRHHVRIYDDLEDVQLVAVADCNPSALERTTRRRTMRGYLDYYEMLDREDLDAVSVVVPTSSHHRVALDVLDHRVSLLVEKPIASDSRKGAEIVERADEAGVVLTVGHIERSNPAVIELRRQLADGVLGRLFQIKARRAGPFPARVTDAGVAIDLATHDLDLMLQLTDCGVERVYGETMRNVHTAHEDMLCALIRFSDGTIGSLDVNWLTPIKQRDLTLIGARGMFVVDYLRQELSFSENGTIRSDWDHLSVLTGVSEGRTVRFVTEHVEPLRAELASFVHSVRTKSKPLVTGLDGLRALVVAEAILESAAASGSVCMDGSRLVRQIAMARS
jgi:UDP-N-acetylglucosamine 3-dehydrogenase